MPLTQAEFQESNLMNSLKDYLNTNIIIPYNNMVANTTFPTPLGIILSKPSDPQQQPQLPLIVLFFPEDAGGENQGLGLGDGAVWYHEIFKISFYPAVDESNSPIEKAASILRSYAKFALGTALFIPQNDYTTSPPTPVDPMEVLTVRLTKASGNMDPIFGLDRYRFDYQLNVRYPVATING